MQHLSRQVRYLEHAANASFQGLFKVVVKWHNSSGTQKMSACMPSCYHVRACNYALLSSAEMTTLLLPFFRECMHRCMDPWTRPSKKKTSRAAPSKLTTSM